MKGHPNKIISINPDKFLMYTVEIVYWGRGRKEKFRTTMSMSKEEFDEIKDNLLEV